MNRGPERIMPNLSHSNTSKDIYQSDKDGIRSGRNNNSRLGMNNAHGLRMASRDKKMVTSFTNA